jgi:hypothetical protein
LRDFWKAEVPLKEDVLRWLGSASGTPPEKKKLWIPQEVDFSIGKVTNHLKQTQDDPAKLGQQM